jgi:hypothetical protein
MVAVAYCCHDVATQQICVSQTVSIVELNKLTCHRYLQFHPVAYLLKLQIELGMADLIVKIVKASNPASGGSGPYKNSERTGADQKKTNQASSRADPWGTRQHHTRIEAGDEVDAMEMEAYGKGIKKTVVTEIVAHEDRSISRSDHMDERRTSQSSSTVHLKRDLFQESH